MYCYLVYICICWYSCRTVCMWLLSEECTFIQKTSITHIKHRVKTSYKVKKTNCETWIGKVSKVEIMLE